ncbi:alpha/beta hydrolase family protein [Aliidiomarina indica]|uniref:alpha/beta hydrolase family protein n=1 Tax=Aliidiomarina indica TaxID=2749147 RepID=UPI00188F9A4F
MFRFIPVLLACAAFAVPPSLSASTLPVSFRDVLELPDVQPDRTLRYGEEDAQFIEVFDARDAGAGSVVFVHGGCWLNAFDVAHGRPLAHALREHGFSVAALEFRRLGDDGGGWPGTLDDIHAALRLLQEDRHFAVQNAVLVGHSAGGHLALLAAQHEDSFAIAGVVGLAAITDIQTYAEGNSGCEQSAARFVSTAPEAVAKMMVQPQPNVHLLHGEEDAIVSQEQTHLADAQVTILPELGHFDLIHPRTSAFPVLLNAIRAFTHHAQE